MFPTRAICLFIFSHYIQMFQFQTRPFFQFSCHDRVMARTRISLIAKQHDFAVEVVRKLIQQVPLFCQMHLEVTEEALQITGCA